MSEETVSDKFFTADQIKDAYTLEDILGGRPLPVTGEPALIVVHRTPPNDRVPKPKSDK